MRLFVFGMGYSAQALVDRLRAHARLAWLGATARSEEAERDLREAGIDTVRFDGTAPAPDLGATLGVASHVLLSIPPGAEGDPVLRLHRDQLLKAAPGLAWIGYLSTVGVYGDHHGDWVTEESECRPVSARSRNRLAAEQAWLAFAEETGVPVGIFRLAGIYGPGRNTLDKLRAGKAKRVVKPGQIFNRIHVDDIAAVLEAAMARPATAIYNVADDEPAPPQDVVAYGAELLGLAPPPEVPFAEAGLSDMAGTFWGESKRISNHRIRAELGVELAYPTYREGLSSLAKNG
ncbi:MAG TPA: SDR family oxidoreductase [Hyphomicrobiales bacterium]|nr:SDR family oxidoreductase [Hyphomicrobiales bacterium]